MQEVFVYVAIICAVFIFMTSRSRKKQQAQQLTMRQALVPGVEARTIGGLVGEVIEVTDEHVVLETTPGVRLKFVKTAVAGILPPAVAEDAEFDTDLQADAESGTEDESEPEDSAAVLGSGPGAGADSDRTGDDEAGLTGAVPEAELSKK